MEYSSVTVSVLFYKQHCTQAFRWSEWCFQWKENKQVETWRFGLWRKQKDRLTLLQTLNTTRRDAFEVVLWPTRKVLFHRDDSSILDKTVIYDGKESKTLVYPWDRKWCQLQPHPSPTTPKLMNTACYLVTLVHNGELSNQSIFIIAWKAFYLCLNTLDID